MIDRAVALIKNGGVIVMPTDTVYGLACDPCNAAAIARIYAIKARPDALELGLLGATRSDFDGLVEFNDVAIGLADRYWPGRLSLILPVAPGAVPTGRQMVLPRAGSTLSVRVPDHDLARVLLAQTGPLATTSANRHGQGEAATAAEARNALGPVVDLVLDGGRALGTASTIIDCTSIPPRLVRAGAVSPTSPIPGVEAEAFQPSLSRRTS